MWKTRHSIYLLRSFLLFKKYYIMIYQKIDIYIQSVIDNDSGLINMTVYDGKNIPPISVLNYIKRLFKFTDASSESHYLTLILLDRILNINNIKLNLRNFHRLYAMSLRIASKLVDDIHYSNLYYSRVSGINIVEYNLLELKYLKDIKWTLNYNQRDIQKIINLLQSL